MYEFYQQKHKQQNRQHGGNGFFTLSSGFGQLVYGGKSVYKQACKRDKANLNIHSEKMIRILRGGNISEMCYTKKNDDVYEITKAQLQEENEEKRITETLKRLKAV